MSQDSTKLKQPCKVLIRKLLILWYFKTKTTMPSANWRTVNPMIKIRTKITMPSANRTTVAPKIILKQNKHTKCKLVEWSSQDNSKPTECNRVQPSANWRTVDPRVILNQNNHAKCKLVDYERQDNSKLKQSCQVQIGGRMILWHS